MTLANILLYLESLPLSSVLVVIVLAVALAPVVYRYCLRFRRILRRFLWIALGFGLGWALCFHADTWGLF